MLEMSGKTSNHGMWGAISGAKYVEEMKEDIIITLDAITLEDNRIYKNWLQCYNRCNKVGGFYLEIN